MPERKKEGNLWQDQGNKNSIWTAYLVDKKHTKRKLLAEYESHKNQNRPA